MDKELNEEILQDLFAWIDKIPLSRPKRNITRDFSDGVMAAEVVKYFFPKLVELHNYTPANSIQQKLSNWGTLNRKVFSKLNFHIPEETVKRIVVSTAGVIEPVLCSLRERIDDKRQQCTEDTLLDVEYYNNRNREKPLTEPPPKKKEERAHVHQHTDKTSTVLGSQVDPTIRLVLEEKEQALLALQETVEILQIKVNRLEHLVQLKDMRLEDLTRHLERYKARANVP
ncbi:sperm flagellar protein 1 isoform X2 [Oncorhynchus mykiss]|uniref:Sperm flagellar 1 n=2 Tax=Oncorhynchus mykiss TaxID=8022 RepID=A0A8C7P7I5_ONCMY|nr:sperm flagellar protein 1 isoform X2 [Oncorhynchus mykiss]XP_035609732.2 sperm flagellar protein 1 isoform X1 [Oncorhynchus keta]